MMAAGRPTRYAFVQPARTVRAGFFLWEYPMRMVPILGFAALACALAGPTAQGEDLKSGPEKKIGGAFQVKAITGGQQGKTLCYV